MTRAPTDIVAQLAHETPLPDIRELLGHIHTFFGGTKEFARMLVEDVKHAPEGSNARLSFHNNYLTAIAKYAGGDPLADLNRDELVSLVQRLIQEGANDTHGGTDAEHA